MRDKLIALINENRACPEEDGYPCEKCVYDTSPSCFVDRLADVLIANGVTVGDVTDNNVVNTPANERLPVKLTRVDFAKCEGCHWQYAPDGQTDCWVCKDNDHYVEGK